LKKRIKHENMPPVSERVKREAISPNVSRIGQAAKGKGKGKDKGKEREETAMIETSP
jgi:hypothetical protein